ncbi:MAG: N-acetyltransferase [Alphaproteobacteria bacterium]|nr:MAG: N-acetyltransferase [Alphaproteobacteria bacterium]
MDGSPAIEVVTLPRIEAIAAAEWDGCACPEAASGRPVDPFTTHRFLAALERSGSVSARAGWQPMHLAARLEGRLIGVMPLYVKSHSQGEYIFDHGWAHAYERAGGDYYPKLQSAVPFTPATGRRFLVAPGETADIARAALAEAAITLARRNRLSSLHVTFCTEEEARAGAALGLMRRTTQQFHWENRGYGDFDAFLADLSSRKRKNIRKERATAQQAGEIIALTGAALQPEHWDAFWQFYQDTGGRKWGRPYLTRGFFDEVQRHMREDALLVLCLRRGRPVAGALNFIGRETLYGRYWGCIEDHPCLHFELCYYQAIDWAIRHGLKRVEAGAQGEHKLARGYLPVEIHSLHWIADPGFRDAVARYLEAEREAVDREIEVLTEYGPFRRGEQQEWQ